MVKLGMFSNRFLFLGLGELVKHLYRFCLTFWTNKMHLSKQARVRSGRLSGCDIRLKRPVLRNRGRLESLRRRFVLFTPSNVSVLVLLWNMRSGGL